MRVSEEQDRRNSRPRAKTCVYAPHERLPFALCGRVKSLDLLCGYGGRIYYPAFSLPGIISFNRRAGAVVEVCVCVDGWDAVPGAKG